MPAAPEVRQNRDNSAPTLRNKARRQSRDGRPQSRRATDDVTVLGHPIRRAIVLALAREPASLSPTAFARLDGVKASRAVYHQFAYLAAAGVVELVESRERVGTVERFYALTARGRTIARHDT
jgi:DNA-binding transcriptional ArsR family regulator